MQPADAGAYSVQVTNAAGMALSSNAVLTVLEQPAITAQPSCLAVAAGANATFAIGACGSAPLTYQWLLNGLNIPGATDCNYTVTNAQTANAGMYSVQVVNAAGTTISSNALLTVNNPPVLAPIHDLTVHAGTLVLFTNSASDGDVPAQSLTFTLDPGYPSDATLDPLTGVFAWPTIFAQAGTTNPITVRVTDNGTPALSDTRTFNVTVLAPPTLQSITAGTNSVTLSWSAIPGAIYRVQAKDSPSDADWTRSRLTLSPPVLPPRRPIRWPARRDSTAFCVP